MYNVSCSFVATLHDYAGNPFVNQSLSLSTVATSGRVGSGPISPGEQRTCSWGITRPQYRAWAPTYMDAQLGLTPLDAGEHPYLLRITVVVTFNGAMAFTAEAEKVICTPKIGAGSLKKRLFCQARRGQYVVPTPDTATGATLAHLIVAGPHVLWSKQRSVGSQSVQNSLHVAVNGLQ